FQPAIDFLDDLARALDDFQDVEAFLVAADLVGELAPAPRVGLLENPAHLLDDALDERVHVGNLLLGRVRLEDVNQFVRTSTHLVSLWTRPSRFAITPCRPVRRSDSPHVVVASPPVMATV